MMFTTPASGAGITAAAAAAVIRNSSGNCNSGNGNGNSNGAANNTSSGGGGGGGGVTAGAGENPKTFKSFMGRTPTIGILKSKFLTVLGNSNDLLNGISSKLTLNISSSDSDYCDDDEEVPEFDETIDYTKIDYESRRVKSRRAHEEIISGRYRQPNLAPRPRLDALRSSKKHEKSRSSSSSSSSSSSTSTSSRSFHKEERSRVSSTTRSNSLESRNSGGYVRQRQIAGARRSEFDMQKDLSGGNNETNKQTTMSMAALGNIGSGGGAGGQMAPHIEVQPPTLERETTSGKTSNHANAMHTTASNHSMRLPPTRRKNSNSSTLTSLRDDPAEYQVSPSVESTDWRHFIRSESQNSVPSWASSISLDCRSGEEPIKEFMKRFTEKLFSNPASIELELKSEFGAMTRLEIGRQWFTRFLLEQKNKSKLVEELTFHYLIQHFSLVLFECGECEDYGAASVIMNLCFLFYREIEVPGCDPYREYLFSFMREQALWSSLRFWNSAFFDALQAERDNRLMAKQKKQERRKAKEKAKKDLAALGPAASIEEQRGIAEGQEKLEESSNAIKEEKVVTIEEKVVTIPDAASSSSSSHHVAHNNKVKKEKPAAKAFNDNAAVVASTADVDKEMENIAFRLVGSYTCNIHALGAPQEICMDFFKKQQASLNLPKDKYKLIRENIYRIYYETEQWGAKQEQS